MNKLGAVISFTYRNKVKTKSFRWTTLVLVLLLIIGMNIPYLIQMFSGNSEGGGTVSIGVAAGPYDDIAEQMREANEKQTFDKKIRPADLDSETVFQWAEKPEAAEVLNAKLENGELDGYLLLQRPENESTFPSVTYVSNKSNLTVQSMLQTAAQTVKLRNVTDGQLSDAQMQEISSPVSLNHVSPKDLNAGEKSTPSGFDNENFILVYLLLILFFISLTMTGNMIASEITSEKSSRVMEILITSMSPLTQMFGKIIGIFLVGLTQMGIYAVVFIAHLMLPYYQQTLAGFDINVANLSVSTALLGLLYYILGYFLYATLYAAVGSIVSRTEDLGQAVSLLTVLTLAAFYIGIFSINNPDSLMLRIASYIPFFSPTTALVRIGLGSMPWWELIISIVLLLIAIIVCGWLSAKIYRTGVLMYGKRPTWKEIRKAMKAYKI